MFRYFVSLMITVLVGTMVLIAWTPTAKSQDGCSSYCESAFICGCAAKLGGNLRETKCEFRGTVECLGGGPIDEPGYEYCDCQPDPKCSHKYEKDEVWLRFPDAYTNPCFPT